jgi:hypothetical protein
MGSLCATSSLAAGEALRKNDEPFLRRITPRMLLSLAFLGSAVVGNAQAWLRTPESAPAGSVLSLLLLAAGAGVTLWAYLRGPRRRGDESLGERLTLRGKLALGLLSAALVVDLCSGGLLGMIKQFQACASGSVSILATLSLVLVTLGTGAVAATFRSGNALLPGTASLLHRLSPLAKGAFTLLGLALAVVGLADLISPEQPMLVCLALLALGITTGLAALSFAPVPGTTKAPGPWSISSRGWVSLAFLGLAGGVLVSQEARLVGLLGNMAVSTANRSSSALREPVGPVTDEPSNWSMKKYQSAQTDTIDSETEQKRLEKEVASLRKQLATLASGTRTDRPMEKNAPGQPARDQAVVDLSQWHHKVDSPGSSRGPDSEIEQLRGHKNRLESELANNRQRIVELEAVKNPGRPQENSAAMFPASTVDVTKWRHPTP